MKRLFGIINLFILLFFTLCGTGYGLSVTFAEGDLSLLSTSTVVANEPITLTFGEEQVIIHDTHLPVPGQPLSDREISLSELFLVWDHRVMSHGESYETIYSYHGCYLAIVGNPDELAADKRVRLWPITHSMVVAESPSIEQADPDPNVQKLINRLKTTEYANYLGKLANPTAQEGLETRFSCSEQARKAANLINAEFKRLGLETNEMEFANVMGRCDGTCREPTGYNIIAKKIGKTRPNDYYLVGAHYDSVNEDSKGGLAFGCRKAPGANDNASGVAGVMELARVFSALETGATIIFAAFGGEEIDLLGSTQYVSTLIERNEAANLKAFVILDMISYASSKEKEGIYIEASNETPAQKQRGEKFYEYAKTYTQLNPVELLWKGRNSDHGPFLDKKMAGGLLIQTQCEPQGTNRYPYLHSEDDTISHQNVVFALEILKVAAATLAEAGIVIPNDNTRQTRATH
jgi:hypothetical protein